MTNHRSSSLGIRAISLVALVLLPVASEALCLKDCQQENISPMVNSSYGYQSNMQSNERRKQSHNFGDNNTAVMGDMNIRVGHERIEIKGMEHSQNSVIDASITSVINMGAAQP